MTPRRRPHSPREAIGILSVCPHLSHVPLISAIAEKFAENGFDVRVFGPGPAGGRPAEGSADIVHVGNPWVWEGYGWLRPLGHRGFLRAWAWRERLRQPYRAWIMVDAAAVELAQHWLPILRGREIYCSLEILVKEDLPAEAQTLRRWHGVESRRLPHYAHYILPDPVRGDLLAREYSLDGRKMIFIPNSWRKIPLKPRTGVLRNMLGLKDTDCLLLYTGNFGPGFGLEEILASVPNWPEPWKLVLHSSFNEKVNPRIAFELDLVRSLAPQGKIFLTPPSLPEEIYWEILGDADAGIAFYTPNRDEWGWLTNNRLMGLASGKVNAYLRAGLPVITNRYTNLGEMLIEPTQSGIVVDSAAEIPQALRLIERQGDALKNRARLAYESRLDPEPGLEQLLAAVRALG